MKIIKKLSEGEGFDSTIIGYKYVSYTDARVFQVTIYLKVISFRIQVGIPKSKEKSKL